MTNSSPAQPVLLTAPPGTPPAGGAPPGAPPGGPLFQSALKAAWARTAIAEGQQESRSENPFAGPRDAGATHSENSPTAAAGGEQPAGTQTPPHTRRGPAKPTNPSPETTTAASIAAGSGAVGHALRTTEGAAGGITVSVSHPTTAGRDATTAQVGAGARANDTLLPTNNPLAPLGAAPAPTTAQGETGARANDTLLPTDGPLAHPGADAPAPTARDTIHTPIAAGGSSARASAIARAFADAPGGGDLPRAGATAPADDALALETGSVTGDSATDASSAPATGSAPTPSTPGSPLAGQALPGGLGESGSGVSGNASLGPAPPTGSNSGWEGSVGWAGSGFGNAGSDSGSAGFRSGDPGSEHARAGSGPRRVASDPSSTTSVAGPTPGEAGWSGASSRAGAYRPAGWAGLRATVRAGAHDTLWVPDSTQSSAESGVGGLTGVAGSSVGLAEASGSVQDPIALAGDTPASLLDYGVGLQQAIETLHGTIQLAARQGLTQARIALEPEGLGEIRIHLTQTAQGLLARVTAETPVATQALAAAHAELRQSLSSLGLNLARLEIGGHGHAAAHDGGAAFGGARHHGATGSGETSYRGNRSGRSTTNTAPTDSPTDLDTAEDAQPAPAPSRGTLVDVLA
jgi:Flagellar hook-length control protein FliK